MTRSAAPAKPHQPSESPKKTERNGFRTVLSLLPYLWPHGETGMRVSLCFALVSMVLAKVATVYVPLIYGNLVDKLTHAAGPLGIPFALIGGYVVVRLASACFAEMRDGLFAGVQARASRVVARQTFIHLHALSMRFHLDRQTGGLSNIILRGTQAIQNVLRLATFNLIPTLLELGITIGVLWYHFGVWYAVVTFAAVGLYVAFTFSFATWRTKFRRTMNDTDTEAQTKAVDSLINFETVKYFGNEDHEAKRFDESLSRYERALIKSMVSLNLLNVGQSLIICLALGVIMLMAAYGVVHHTMTPGHFVAVITYLMQLYIPLNFLGFTYMTLSQGLVDMEQMFSLLGVHQEVKDKPHALPLASHGAPAEIIFKDVQFGYNPDREILKGVSFSAAPGKKIAIVGPTGSGKSTISRLLFRFYDVTSGTVQIDGHDVRDYRQHDLRAAIGVVPQDTVLFNDTIKYNIAYGRPGATMQDITHAAQLAQIHDFITALPQGYNTKVGERGLKLSGGEKQRVAIARTILKDPRVLVLDEATSALDTATEQGISTALRSVAQHRTTLVIAHRLSTVTDADEILVLRDGLVVERGTHMALLALGGVYATMWAAQATMAEEEPLAEGIIPPAL